MGGDGSRGQQVERRSQRRGSRLLRLRPGVPVAARHAAVQQASAISSHQQPLDPPGSCPPREIDWGPVVDVVEMPQAGLGLAVGETVILLTPPVYPY